MKKFLVSVAAFGLTFTGAVLVHGPAAPTEEPPVIWEDTLDLYYPPVPMVTIVTAQDPRQPV